MGDSTQEAQAFEGVIEYGKAAIRSVFVLNGAAIIGLFTFMSSVMQTQPTAVHQFVSSLWVFVAGLIFAVATTVATYVSYLCELAMMRGRGWGKGWAKAAFVAPFVLGLLALVSFVGGCALVACALRTLA